MSGLQSSVKYHGKTPTEGGSEMIRRINTPVYQEIYEYFGNTAVLLTRKLGSLTVWRDWLLFNTVEEASEYFNTNCYATEG